MKFQVKHAFPTLNNFLFWFVPFSSVKRTLSKGTKCLLLITKADGKVETFQYPEHKMALEVKRGFEYLLAHPPTETGGVSSCNCKELTWRTLDNRRFHGDIFFSEDSRFGKKESRAIWCECVPRPDTPAEYPDGQCSICCGIGCCACGHTGGYGYLQYRAA